MRYVPILCGRLMLNRDHKTNLAEKWKAYDALSWFLFLLKSNSRAFVRESKRKRRRYSEKMSEKILKITELFLYLEEFLGENVGENVLKSLMNSAISSNVGVKPNYLKL